MVLLFQYIVIYGMYMYMYMYVHFGDIYTHFLVLHISIS